MKIKLLIILLSVIPLSTAWGNGMGTYAISSAVRSGNPVCRKIEDIVLLSEKLQIDLKPGGYSEITVKYVLWNPTDKDYSDIDYAFPVDYLSGSLGMDIPKPIIKNVHFTCDEKTLDFAKSDSVVISKAEMKSLPLSPMYYMDAFERESALFCRRWYYTRFSVGKHSLVNLEVKYTLRNLELADGVDPCLLYYLDYCYPHLVYDFSPASSWGDGIIRDFQVEVNGYDISERGNNTDLEEGNDRQIQIEGLDFQKEENNKYVYRTHNFNLHKVRPLYIHYNGPGISSLEMLSRYMVSPSEYSVKASREQENHPIGNISDMDLETAWVAKGVGDWIEFSFDEKTVSRLAGFCIVNGYQKSPQTYEQNNRVKKLKIELKDTTGMTIINSDSLVLADRPYKLPFFENLMEYGAFYDFFETGCAKIIRLTIEEVYPGTKYDDTCISEFLFLSIEEVYPKTKYDDTYISEFLFLSGFYSEE